MNLPTPPYPPAPRKVRGLLRQPGFTAARLIILPHSLIGAALLLFVAIILLYTLAGIHSPGTITELSQHADTKGRISYTASFRYDFNNTTHLDTHSDLTPEQLTQLGLSPHQASTPHLLEEAPLEKISLQHPADVRHIGLGNLRFARLIQAESATSLLAFALTFALFWNGILSIFVYALYIIPFKQWRLLRIGIPATGIITDLTTTSSSSKNSRRTRYCVHYIFPHPQTLQPVKGSTYTSHAQWASAVRNTPVTILYHPKNPARNIAPDFTPFDIRPAQGDPSINSVKSPI